MILPLYFLLSYRSFLPAARRILFFQSSRMAENMDFSLLKTTVSYFLIDLIEFSKLLPIRTVSIAKFLIAFKAADKKIRSRRDTP